MPLNDHSRSLDSAEALLRNGAVWDGAHLAALDYTRTQVAAAVCALRKSPADAALHERAVSISSALDERIRMVSDQLSKQRPAGPIRPSLSSLRTSKPLGDQRSEGFWESCFAPGRVEK